MHSVVPRLDPGFFVMSNKQHDRDNSRKLNMGNILDNSIEWMLNFQRVLILFW